MTISELEAIIRNFFAENTDTKYARKASIELLDCISILLIRYEDELRRKNKWL